MRQKQNNKKKLLIAVVVGIIASVVVFSAFNSYNKRISEQKALISNLKQKADETVVKAIEDPNMVKIVVAKIDLPSGTKLTNLNTDLKGFLPKDMPPETYKDAISVIGYTLNDSCVTGEPITRTKIKEFQTSTLEIPTGSRAVTVPFEFIQGYSSNIKIGTKIDLISASKDVNGSNIVLQNSKIISFESTPKPPNPDGTTAPPTLTGITFQVQAKDTSKLVDAMTRGKLQIIERNAADDNVIKVQEMPKPIIDLGSVVPSPPKLTATAPPSLPPSLPSLIPDKLPGGGMGGLGGLPAPATPKKKTSKVELIQSNVRSEIEFDN